MKGFLWNDKLTWTHSQRSNKEEKNIAIFACFVLGF